MTGLRRALLDPGRVPQYHYNACADLRRTWPTLWAALRRCMRSTDRKDLDRMADLGDLARGVLTITVDGVDPANPRHQGLVGSAAAAYRRRYGKP